MSYMLSGSTVPNAFRNAMFCHMWTSFGCRMLYKMSKMWQVFLAIQAQLLTKCTWNPYSSLSLYIFRLQAVFSYFCSHLFILIFLLFSSDGMADEKKKKRHRRPQKGPAKPRTVGASHWNKDMNQWQWDMMKQCIKQCK